MDRFVALLVEKGARALDPEAWKDPIPTRAAIEDSHRRRQTSCANIVRVLEALSVPETEEERIIRDHDEQQAMDLPVESMSDAQMIDTITILRRMVMRLEGAGINATLSRFKAGSDDNLPITIETLDEALKTIIGPGIQAYMDPGEEGISNRTIAMSRAAEKAWITERPEDKHSRVLRQGLKNLNRHSTILAPAKPEG